MHAAENEEPSIDVAELAGPPGLPGPLYDNVPKDEHGRSDWERLHHALQAVENLLAAGMADHARSVVRTALTIANERAGASANVIPLLSRR